ncbi:MAG: TerB family tellurite resistance protein [Pseudomonadota bacterium]
MFEFIKKFVTDLEETDQPHEYLHSRKQLAEAALMYHVIAVDGIVSEDEKLRMQEVLASHFEIDGDQAQQLLKDARDADNEAIDLYKFTKIIKENLEEDERVQIIENLWEMVFADGVVHELEDNVVWRIAELLGVDGRDRMALKQRIWKRRSDVATKD